MNGMKCLQYFNYCMSSSNLFDLLDIKQTSNSETIKHACIKWKMNTPLLVRITIQYTVLKTDDKE